MAASCCIAAQLVDRMIIAQASGFWRVLPIASFWANGARSGAGLGLPRGVELPADKRTHGRSQHGRPHCSSCQ